MKKCSICHEEKQRSEFFANKNTSDKLASECKECKNKQRIARLIAAKGKCEVCEVNPQARRGKCYKCIIEHNKAKKQKAAQKPIGPDSHEIAFAREYLPMMGEWARRPIVVKEAMCETA